MLKDKDVLHELLYKIFPRWGVANTENSPINRQARSSLRVKNNLQENILNSTKHKNIYGVRMAKYMPIFVREPKVYIEGRREGHTNFKALYVDQISRNNSKVPKN